MFIIFHPIKHPSTKPSNLPPGFQHGHQTLRLQLYLKLSANADAFHLFHLLGLISFYYQISQADQIREKRDAGALSKAASLASDSLLNFNIQLNMI